MAENVAERDNAARRPVPRLPTVSLTVFDASHCYWLEPQFLLDRILQMKNLEELCINDTKLGLSHLLQIFKCCKKIRKLSFSLKEKETLNEFKEQRITRSQVSKETIMKQGFQKITHLKIFSPSLNGFVYTNNWLTTLGILK